MSNVLAASAKFAQVQTDSKISSSTRTVRVRTSDFVPVRGDWVRVSVRIRNRICSTLIRQNYNDQTLTDTEDFFSEIFKC